MINSVLDKTLVSAFVGSVIFNVSVADTYMDRLCLLGGVGSAVAVCLWLHLKAVERKQVSK